MALQKGTRQTQAIQKLGVSASKRQADLKKNLKLLMDSGQIDDLQKKALENYAEMLDDPDKQVRAFATKEISKYIFATKKEVTKFPVININCNFIGIKDNQESRNDNSKI